MTLRVSSDYRSSELVADGIIHVLGLVFAIIACVLLWGIAQQHPSVSAAVCYGLYGTGIVCMLGFSAGYNLTVAGPRKALLRRLDHASIFVMIAGTYSAYSVVAFQGGAGAVLLGCIWVIAVCGAAIKLSFPNRFERLSLALYLAMGWSGLLVIHTLFALMPGQSLLLLIVGGCLYTTGVLFHLNHRLPYHNAIWHAFVLAAVICHFISIVELA